MANQWLELGEAEVRLLTVDRPASVAAGYKRALANADEFAIGSFRQQLELLRRLGVCSANVEAALSQFPAADPRPTQGPRPRAVLLAGHAIDTPGRKERRFPADKEAVARNAILETLKEELAAAGGVSRGMAGGASGGDLLFHEVCTDVGLASTMFLPLPRRLAIARTRLSCGPILGWALLADLGTNSGQSSWGIRRPVGYRANQNTISGSAAISGCFTTRSRSAGTRLR